MRREWEPEELIACWTLMDADWRLVANKSGATRLGFAVLLKFFELEGRFPRHAGEPPPAAVAYVAQQVKVDPGEFATGYAFSGRTVEYHRAQIRTALGFREAGRVDERWLTAWLADAVCPGEPDDDRQRNELLRRCRQERIEPPGRLDRILGAAPGLADERFCEETVARLSSATIAKLEELVGGDDPSAGDEHDRRAVGGGPGLLAELKADPRTGQVLAAPARAPRAGRSAPSPSYETDPRVNDYIDRLPDWQQAICRELRDLIHGADPDISETINRTVQPYFVLQGNACALLATKDHVNLFLYDGGIVRDPEGIITAGHEHKTARMIFFYCGDTINAPALTAMLQQIIANNRAGRWRKLKRDSGR